MEWIKHGTIQNGQVVLSAPLGMPEGTEVVVRIEPVQAPEASSDRPEAFASLPFFGLWADREDMADSEAWVAKEREAWHRRLSSRS